MKFSVLIIFLFYLTTATYPSLAQTNRSNDVVGVSFVGFGQNDAINLTSLDGAASYSGDGYFGVQIDYIRSINKVLAVETGIGFRHHSLVLHPAEDPSVSKTTQPVSANILMLPIGLRVNFLKYVFVNAGLSIDTSIQSTENISDQNGIGFYLGAGLKYEFESGLGFYANPFTSIHSAISFNNGQYPERILEGGVKLGITYRLL